MNELDTVVPTVRGASVDLGVADRKIVHRTRGEREGPITRLMSPEDLGEVLKPFVFLDLFEVDAFAGRGFAPHPHSGIATITAFLAGSMTYADSTGKTGALTDGAVEWMQAGSGVWHTGQPAQGVAIRGYQLWLALPRELELAPPQGLYVEPSRIKQTGPARVLLGRYNETDAPIPYPVPLTYLHVRLQDGERWTYRPDAAHTIAWLAINTGKIRIGTVTLERELAVFAEGNDSINVVATGMVEFVIGSAVKHPYPLVNGNHSVHTTPDTLAQGERNIEALRRSDAVASLRQA